MSIGAGKWIDTKNLMVKFVGKNKRRKQAGNDEHYKAATLVLNLVLVTG